MTRLMLIPVAFWSWRVTAREAVTAVGWTQVASRVWRKTGRAGRSCLLMRKGRAGCAAARGRRRQPRRHPPSGMG